MDGGGRGDSHVSLQWSHHTFEMRVSVRFQTISYRRSPARFQLEEREISKQSGLTRLVMLPSWVQAAPLRKGDCILSLAFTHETSDLGQQVT